jgi:nitrite reductase (NADH) small subunit
MNAASNITWTTACRIEAILPFSGVCALINKKQIAIFRLKDDQLYAVDNYDPFSKANVLSRGIVGDLKDSIVVASPIYKQHFDLKTGQCLEDDTVQILTYKVRNNNGCVEITTSN